MESIEVPARQPVLAPGWARALGAALLLALVSLLSNITSTAQLEGRANALLTIRLVISKLVNSGTAWAGLAILAGWLVGRRLQSMWAAILCCELALVAHYALGNLIGVMDSSIWWANKSWFVFAIVFGAPLGLCGAAARRRDRLGLAARLLVPLGAMVEPFAMGMLTPPGALPRPDRVAGGICGVLLILFGAILGFIVIRRWRSQTR
jgi:hypothetical protein